MTMPRRPWYALSDFDMQKVDESGQLAEHLEGLDINDLGRVFAAAGHELFHRRPDIDRETFVRELLAGIDEVHRAKLP